MWQSFQQRALYDCMDLMPTETILVRHDSKSLSHQLWQNCFNKLIKIWWSVSVLEHHLKTTTVDINIFYFRSFERSNILKIQDVLIFCLITFLCAFIWLFSPWNFFLSLVSDSPKNLTEAFVVVIKENQLCRKYILRI